MEHKMKRAYNFNAGPSALPHAVIQKAQEEFGDFQGTGMSLMEMSHRGPVYEEVHNAAVSRLRQLLAIPDNYEVLFLQGGASLQFSMVPMNFLDAGQKAGYLVTGTWAEKAFAEAKLFGEPYAIKDTKDARHNHVPALAECQWNEEDAYVHITSNNTIYGTQFHEFPDTGEVPLIADMSSDIMSKPIDVSKFGLIYAGAQKNLGPSGVTVVIIRKDLLEKTKTDIPTILKYSTHAKNNSLYNTPPTFGIYMLGEVLKWIEQSGGLEVIAKQNEEKAKLIYDAIDESDGFYIGHAEKSSRSLMNITFKLQSEELDKAFLAEAKAAGFVGLNGHRSIGGCRASTYNALPVETCQALREFMIQFQQKNS